jgi:Fe-S cluster assembly protein SufD
MNMQSKRPITAAEQALVEGFFSLAESLPGDDRIAALRNSFIDDIKQNGLPTRRVEAWHYTDLRSLLKSVPASDKRTSAGSVDPLVAGSNVIAVVNGSVQSVDAPDGVRCDFYRDALVSGEAARRMAARDEDDVIGRINGAYVTDGSNLEIDAGASLEDVLEIQVVHGGGQAHTRFPVRIGDGAKGVFVERHIAAGEEDALVSSITDLQVGHGAEIVWVISQEQGLADTHFGQINIQLGTDAKLTLFVANAGGRLVRQEIHITASGEGSELVLRGVNLLGGESHTDVTMTLDHLVPNCQSTETFRNVVFDRARGVFQGQIKVAPIAQKTDAKMACNTLLLSDSGDFSSKPELEIFADDVQCGHGATVTDIDDNHLFYLMARGIREKKARAMLVKAFTAEIVEELDHEGLIEALETRFDAWLDDHG